MFLFLATYTKHLSRIKPILNGSLQDRNCGLNILMTPPHFRHHLIWFQGWLFYPKANSLEILLFSARNLAIMLCSGCWSESVAQSWFKQESKRAWGYLRFFLMSRDRSEILKRLFCVRWNHNLSAKIPEPEDSASSQRSRDKLSSRFSTNTTNFCFGFRK